MKAFGKIPTWILGELIGTFLLVFFGLGAVAAAVSCEAHVGLFQVAIIWGLGLASAIYSTAHLSGAHFNPAITIAFSLYTNFSKKLIVPYILIQMVGAFLAAATVYVLFGGMISSYESAQEITRGSAGSEATAMIFGEYYPNPEGKSLPEEVMKEIPAWRAFVAELLGTALLAFAIFTFIARENDSGPKQTTPLLIGLTLTVLIGIFAPLTMAGFNPARDFAPRVFSSLAGWGEIPFQVNGNGWWTVYILAPIAGAILGGGIAKVCYPQKG